MTKRPDGRFDVTCTDGTKEIRTEREIFDNQVCLIGEGPVIYSCRANGDIGRDIFAKNGKLFWRCDSSPSTTNSYILSASTTPGGTVTTVGESAPYHLIWTLHSDNNSDYLVYQERGGGPVYAFDTRNMTTPPLHFPSEECLYIAADTRHIYCRGQNAFSRVALSSPNGTGFTQLLSDSSFWSAFALDGPVTNRIVYTAGGTAGWVNSFTPTNTTPTSIATAQNVPLSAQVFGDTAYWLTREGLVRAPKAGGGTPSFAQQRVGIQRYIIDPRGNIYFHLYDQKTNTSSIEKVESSATSIRLQTGLVLAAGLAADDQYIYTISNNGSIHRTLKR